MEGMDHGHMKGMDGMAMAPSSSSSSSSSSSCSCMMHHQKKKMMMMMHMTFFWDTAAEVLFSGWPGENNIGMYVLSLFFVFVLSFLVECFSHSNIIKSKNNVAAGVVQTIMHGLRMGLAYLVMLAVMSFNGGVFLAALFGHVLGFFCFGSRVFKKHPPPPEYYDLPPMSC